MGVTPARISRAARGRAGGAWSATVALTGTPGTGKSSVARALPKGIRWEEVGDAAARLGAGHRRGRTVELDLARLERSLRGELVGGSPSLLVGHLAHLLPVREAILLRCDPRVLRRRLDRARRGSPSARQANVEAEATDVILREALDRHLRVYEIDTTGRPVPTVAREVVGWLSGPRPERYGELDWLADPLVTEQLLGRSR